MKRIAILFSLVLLVGGFCATGAEAKVNRGLDCSKCHSFSNQPPIANAGADQTVNAGAGVTLNGSSSTDADDGIASYAWTQMSGPVVSLSNAGTSRATFTAPGVSSQTVLTFQLTVKDRFNQASTDTCTVTVRAAAAVNQPPVANAGADLTVSSGSSVTLNGQGSSDPDDGIGSYAWVQTAGPGVTLANVASATASFKAPQVTKLTSLSFRLTVTDRSGASSSDTCVVTVNADPVPTNNSPPVADAGLDMAVLPGTFHNLDGFYSSDTDDGIASTTWEQTQGPSVTLSDPAAMSPIFQAPNGPATLSFRLVVTDKGGLQDTDTCTVVVLSADGGYTPPPEEPAPVPTNQPPVANAGQDITARSGTMVSLTGTGSRDSDDGIASYQWRQVSGTSVKLSKDKTPTPSFKAPTVGSSGARLTFELTVKDRSGQTSSDTVTVSVYRAGTSDVENDD